MQGNMIDDNDFKPQLLAGCLMIVTCVCRNPKCLLNIIVIRLLFNDKNTYVSFLRWRIDYTSIAYIE